MYIVYALKSNIKNYIYVGMTNNLERRFGQHNNGQVQSTKHYLPFNIIFKEFFKTRAEARIKEKYFKSGCGKEFLKSL